MQIMQTWGSEHSSLIGVDSPEVFPTQEMKLTRRNPIRTDHPSLGSLATSLSNLMFLIPNQTSLP